MDRGAHIQKERKRELFITGIYPARELFKITVFVKISQPCESRYTSHDSCTSTNDVCGRLTARCGNAVLARTVSVGVHFSTSYPVVTFTSWLLTQYRNVVDTAQIALRRCLAPDVRPEFSSVKLCRERVEVPQIQFLS